MSGKFNKTLIACMLASKICLCHMVPTSTGKHGKMEVDFLSQRILKRLESHGILLKILEKLGNVSQLLFLFFL